MSLDLKTLKRSKFIGLEAINFILKPLHTSLLSLVVIRMFGLDLWGGFVIFIVGVDLFSSFINWGQKPYLLRAFSLEPAKMEQQLGKTLISRVPLLLIAITAICILPQIKAYATPVAVWLTFKWLSLLFDSVIQYHRKYWNSIIAEVFAILVSLVGIYCYKDDFSENELVMIFAAASVVRLIALSPLLKNLKIKELSFAEIKKELLLALPFFGLTVAGLIQTKGDLFVVAYLLSDESLATYQVLISFLMICQTFSWIVLGPFQKNIYRINAESIQKIKSTYLKVGLGLSLLFSAALILVLNFIYLLNIPVWYSLLFFAYLFPLYYYLIETQTLLKNNGEKYLFRYNLVAAFVNITLSLVLVSFYGIIGALLSGIACRLILAKLVVSQSKRIKNVSVN